MWALSVELIFMLIVISLPGVCRCCDSCGVLNVFLSNISRVDRNVCETLHHGLANSSEGFCLSYVHFRLERHSSLCLCSGRYGTDMHGLLFLPVFGPCMFYNWAM